MKRTLLILLTLIPVSAFAYPCPQHTRSQAAKRAFVLTHPCPANGKRTTHCPGYFIDHIKPLACCGADAPSNMQWQSTKAAKAKDKIELKQCTWLTT